MATQRKKTTAKSTSGAKGRSRSRSQQPEDFSLGVEIGICVLFFFSILLFLSNFNLIGSAGKLFSGIFKGLFGIMAYPFPVVLFFGTALYIANRTHKRAVAALIGGILIFLALCAFFQLVLAEYYPGTPVSEYYKAYSRGAIAGGFFGGIITALFSSVFGKVGAYLLTILLAAIGIILVSRKPLMTLIGQSSGQAIRNADQRRREIAERRREEREEWEERKESRRSSERQERPARTRREYDPYELYEDSDDRDERPAERRPKSDRTKVSSPAGRRNASSGEILPWDPISEGKSAERAKAGDIRTSAADLWDDRPEEDGSFREKTQPEKKRGKPVVSHPSLKTGDKKDKPGEAGAKEPSAEEISVNSAQEFGTGYVLPPVDLLVKTEPRAGDSKAYMRETAEKLESTLADFGVQVHVTNVSRGPAVTRYELEPEHGVKISRIVALTNDIKLGLAAADIRIEAPIPGKSAVGIEVPNKENSAVPIRDMIDSPEFRNFPSKLAFTVGKDLAGKPVIYDIKKMPHLLIAGATGSGKSVCINTLIMSILYKATPAEVKMILIDPKVIELSIYNGIPHLLLPVVTDPKKAAGALGWAVSEMEKRYKAFAEIGAGIRDLGSYNMSIRRRKNDPAVPEAEKKDLREMPQILIIVDELADLMMIAPGEVEQSICRLTQLARAAGIHLVVATQRPSVNVITGLIKANIPSRIAFAVSSGVDSRTILDMIGAERLLGKGDMLFYPLGYTKPSRIQGTYISDEEVGAVVAYVKENYGTGEYDPTLEKEIEKTSKGASPDTGGSDDRDEFFEEAGRFIIEKDKASIGMLQRQFRIGFNRAARIMDQLCDAGVVGEDEGTKPRQILMTIDQFDAYMNGEGDGDV